jgi:hypothetical protein
MSVEQIAIIMSGLCYLIAGIFCPDKALGIAFFCWSAGNMIMGLMYLK